MRISLWWNEQTFPVLLEALLRLLPENISDAGHCCSSTWSSKLIISKEFTMLAPSFGCFCWTFSTCYNNDIFFRKRTGIGAFVQYQSMPRRRQEGEGSHLFSSICNSSLDWNISSWTLLWLGNIWKALALTTLHVLTKKKATLCLLLPAPFLSNGLVCWRM